MSAFAWIDWTRRTRPLRSLRTSAEITGAPAPRREWVGIDLSGDHELRRPRALVPLLLLVVSVALAIAALRVDLIRTRYAIATVLKQEQALLEEQRTLIVHRRRLRDPVALAVAARARGFRPTAPVLVLTDPPVESRATGGIGGQAEGRFRDTDAPAISASPHRSTTP